jgi:hypothetical protein
MASFCVKQVDSLDGPDTELAPALRAENNKTSVKMHREI